MNIDYIKSKLEEVEVLKQVLNAIDYNNETLIGSYYETHLSQHSTRLKIKELLEDVIKDIEYKPHYNENNKDFIDPFDIDSRCFNEEPLEPSDDYIFGIDDNYDEKAMMIEQDFTNDDIIEKYGRGI